MSRSMSVALVALHIFDDAPITAILLESAVFVVGGGHILDCLLWLWFFVCFIIYTGAFL